MMKFKYLILLIFFIGLFFTLSASAFNLGDVLRELEVEQPRQPEQPTQPTQPEQPEQKRRSETSDILNIIGKGLVLAQALQPIKYKEEKALGGAIAVQVFSRFGGSYNNESVLQYVNLIGNSVAAFSDRPNIPYHFAVLNNPEPNAFAAPGGYIFITRGLLRKIKNEAELAGVLGHEIAHVSQKHTLKTLQRSKLLQGVSDFTLTLMDENPEKFKQVIDDLTNILFEKGLDQKLEYEADKIGTDFAYRTGYNPGGLKDFLNTLRKVQGKESSIFFKTHPSPSNRLNRLIKNVLPKYRGTGKYSILSLRFKLQTKGKL